MKKTLASMALTLVLAACGQDQTATETVAMQAAATPKHSGLLSEHMNPDVRPGDDFNAFVNGGWIDSAEIPADKPGYGIGIMLRDQSQEHVKAIIEASAAGDFARGSDEQKVGDLYASYMDMETRNRLGVTPLHAEFEKIDALKDHQQLAVYFAEANKIGINLPFEFAQTADFKDPKHYMMVTFQGAIWRAFPRALHRALLAS